MQLSSWMSCSKKQGDEIGMEIEKIQMPKERAKAEWKKYNELIKKRHDKYLEDMKKCMYQLSQGNALIDINKVMEKAGVTKNYEPKLAIARADWKEAHFHKKDSGRGFFAGSDRSWFKKSDDDIDLPPETFCQWIRIKDDIQMKDGTTRKADSRWDIQTPQIKTKVPIIPARLIPEGQLSEYYILWEVKEWENLPEQKDPILLKRITENLFVILGAWEVTALEQSIISGR